MLTMQDLLDARKLLQTARARNLDAVRNGTDSIEAIYESDNRIHLLNSVVDEQYRVHALQTVESATRMEKPYPYMPKVKGRHWRT